jgi:hypothetical protein
VTDLLEQAAGWLGDMRTAHLTALPNAVWVGCENSPLYSPEHMKELRQFTGVLTLTFRVLR